MFDRVRYFIEDLSATALVAIGAVLGLALGVLVTTQLTSGTPYSETDLDRAASTSLLSSEPPTTTAGPDTSTDDAEVAALEEKITDLRALLTEKREASDELQATLDILNEKLERIMARRKYLVERVAAAEDAPNTSDVTGTVTTTSTFGEDEKPWPATCAGLASAFQVKVATDDATVFIAQVSDGDTTRRDEEEDGSLTMACSFSYTATLPLPLAESYTFTAVATADAGKALDSATSDPDALGDGDAPSLAAG